MNKENRFIISSSSTKTNGEPFTELNKLCNLSGRTVYFNVIAIDKNRVDVGCNIYGPHCCKKTGYKFLNTGTNASGENLLEACAQASLNLLPWLREDIIEEGYNLV